MRLIDADALLERAVPHGWSTPLWVSDIVIEDAPTIDAVEVVRCRDCEWYKTNYLWNGKERKVCGIEPFEPIRQEEDYCAYGERRE